MRRYYLHTRHNGTFYAELIDPHTGVKLTARSTGTKSRDEALLKIAEWLKNGIPTGRIRKPRTLEATAGIENILKAIREFWEDDDPPFRLTWESVRPDSKKEIAAIKRRVKNQRMEEGTG